jgi:hypothetical protein
MKNSCSVWVFFVGFAGAPANEQGERNEQLLKQLLYFDARALSAIVLFSLNLFFFRKKRKKENCCYLRFRSTSAAAAIMAITAVAAIAM